MAHTFLTSRVTQWSMAVVALVLFAVTNLPWHLDDYDQAKQAFTSFEMVERGHWFYQHTPNWWVATKPPFVGWTSAGVFALTRSWELAWRLPSLLAAIALLVLLLRSARRYGGVAAVIAAGAFCFNLFVPRLASLVRTDMPLALAVFAVGVMILDKIRAGREWTNRDRFFLFLLLSAGVLIKGPIIYVFLLPPLGAFMWRWRGTAPAAYAWPGWLPWLLSFLVFLIWVAGGILFVPEFTEHVVLREFAGRFNEGVHRPQPLYFYLPHLVHRWAPWSLLLIGLAILARRNEGAVRPRVLSPEMSWLVAWSVAGLLVMSFVPSKRIDRIFPLVPPLCLLLAAVVATVRETERWRAIVDRCCLVALLLSMFALSAYTARKVVIASREQRDAFAVFGRAVVQQATARGWRYGVVGRDDEGMLLYLRDTEFLDVGTAVADWNSRKIDAVVVPEDVLPDLVPRLRGGEAKKILTSNSAGRYRKRYLLLARAPGP